MLYICRYSVIMLILATGHANHARHPVVDKRPRPIICAQDSLMIYFDCRMCVCPRPNKLAICARKLCDIRTKPTGQCPMSVMWVDYSQLCPEVSKPGCRMDTDCPGDKLCCFDFCNEAKCQDPIPLDTSTGIPTHRGFQKKMEL